MHMLFHRGSFSNTFHHMRCIFIYIFIHCQNTAAAHTSPIIVVAFLSSQIRAEAIYTSPFAANTHHTSPIMAATFQTSSIMAAPLLSSKIRTETFNTSPIINVLDIAAAFHASPSCSSSLFPNQRRCF